MISFEECQKIGNKNREEEKKRKEKISAIRNERLRRDGINLNIQKNENPKYDSPYALENSGATVLWLVISIGALIFNGGWILSIIVTIIWFNYITRHMNVDGGNK